MRLIGTAFLCAMAAAAQAPVVRHYAADQFSILVPAEWVEIPKAELEQMTAKARELAPKANTQPYNYGFQASGASPYPRVIIQVKRTGRWSEDVLAKLPRVASEKAKIESGVKSAGPGLAALHLEIGTVQWDAAARVAWMRIEFDAPDGGRVAGLTGVHPTAFGSVQVNCYARQSEFAQMAPTFAAIIGSVRIDEAARYRERVGRMVAAPALMGMAFAGAAIFATGRIRRGKAAPTPVSRRARVVGAAWKLPLGTLLLFGYSNTLRNALAGDGWLQGSPEAQGYWAVWGAMICVSAYLIYRGSRDVLALRALPH